MNKSERLLQLVTLLRSKRYAVTAQTLAETLNVSERTIYRDIQSLVKSGLPIEGEAGVGYLMQSNSHLPPLMFDENELVALELGMRMVETWGDTELSHASKTAATKIRSILTDKLKQRIENFSLLVPSYCTQSTTADRSQILRHATDKHRKIRINYQDESSKKTTRLLQPLGQMYWGQAWTLLAWCELRNDYRSFRIDRIETVEVLDTHFETSKTKSLEHYIANLARFG